MYTSKLKVPTLSLKLSGRKSKSRLITFAFRFFKDLNFEHFYNKIYFHKYLVASCRGTIYTKTIRIWKTILNSRAMQGDSVTL